MSSNVPAGTDRPPRPARGSWWLEEALADPAFAGPPAPSLDRDTTADVLIVGGGYTGLWSAWFLTEREPGIDVVLLEQDICGGGPSGRNGGFVNGFYDEAELLLDRFGDEGRRTVELAGRSIDEVGAWCEANVVDAWYRPTGNLGVSTSRAQDGALANVLASTEAAGFGAIYRRLDSGEVRERFNSPVVRTGVHVRHAAMVHPARLARGLRRALLERGVRIHEGTRVRRFRSRSPIAAETPGGTVRAGRAILGLNAWAVAWPRFRRAIVARGTYLVASAPAPDRLERMRWTGGEGVYDFRTALHYLCPTPDGRILFGGGVIRVNPKRIDPRYDYEGRAVAELCREFRRWFPAFDGIELECAWGGPVDVAGFHLPFFGTLPGGAAHYALGFTGNGVGPCHLAGRILSGFALEAEDEATSLPIARMEPKRFPPEPLLTPGELLVMRAIVRKDGREDRGRRAGPLTRVLAHLPRRVGYNLGP